MVRGLDEQKQYYKDCIKDTKKVLKAQKREDYTITGLLLLAASGVYGTHINPETINHIGNPEILLPALGGTAVLAFIINSLCNSRKYRKGLKDELKAYKKAIIQIDQQKRQALYNAPVRTR